MQVKDSVVVITGGGSGIGASCAKMLAAAGAKIVVAGRRLAVLEQLVEEIKGAGGEAIAVATDITVEEDVARLMDTAIETFGRLDVVHANAGTFADSLFINTDKEGNLKGVMSTEKFKKVMDINLLGTFLTLREGASRMVENRWNGLLLITSSINSTGQLGQLNYSSTKVALTLWPKVMVGEFLMRRIPIRVVGISPGYTATDILTGMNPDALGAVLKDVHIGRLVESEEIAAVAMHVIENDSIDGTTIEVTGGLTYGPRSRAK
jgi:3-oxoacyl-[acyl-carrier protein] reductase